MKQAYSRTAARTSRQWPDAYPIAHTSVAAAAMAQHQHAHREPDEVHHKRSEVERHELGEPRGEDRQLLEVARLGHCQRGEEAVVIDVRVEQLAVLGPELSVRDRVGTRADDQGGREQGSEEGQAESPLCYAIEAGAGASKRQRKRCVDRSRLEAHRAPSAEADGDFIGPIGPAGECRRLFDTGLAAADQPARELRAGLGGQAA